MLKYVIIGLVFVVIAFCVGRSCAPTPIISRQRAEDSLKRVEIRENALIMKANREAEAAYNRGIEMGKSKAVYVTRYVFDTAYNHRLRKAVRDSLIRVWLQLGALDSTKLSAQASTAVWDLNTDLHYATETAQNDSIEIADLKIAYAKKDTALVDCMKAGRADSTRVGMVIQDKKQLQKEVRKQKRVKWLAIIGGIAGVLLLH